MAANGLMHFGTTSDRFLRENLDWLKRASNWAKFTATGSLGVIHYVRRERKKEREREKERDRQTDRDGERTKTRE